MELLPVTCILFPPNPPAGMNRDTITIWYLRLHKVPDPCDPPIEVTSLGDGLYRISDGRHRFVGAMCAGRTHIEAIVV